MNIVKNTIARLLIIALVIILIDVSYAEQADKNIVISNHENSSNKSAEKYKNVIIKEDKLTGSPCVAIDSIDISGKKSICTINGEHFYEGDTINGFTIKKIWGLDVVFQKDGKTFMKGIPVSHPQCDKENENEMQLRQQQSKLLKKQDERINTLQQWLQKERQNIESWYAEAKQRIPGQRQNIENWYQNNLGSLQQWRNAAIERLKVDDRGATARFLQNQNNTVSYTDVESVTNGYISPYGYVSATTSSFGVSSTSVRGDPAGQFSSETACIANSKIAVENNYQEELRKLQNRRSSYLNSISEDSLQCEKTRALREAENHVEYVKWEAISNKRDIIATTKDRLAGGPGVIIDAIGKSGKKIDCSIGGRIYHQGDTVNGFNISKISASEVIFEKDGKTFAKVLQ